MKRPSFPRHGRNLLFASLVFACVSLFAPAARADDGQLIIRRAANFGSYAWLEIWIDGRKIEKGVAMGHDFRTTLSPGHHVIALRRRPPDPYSHINHVPLDVHSGTTYQFTAFYRTDRVVLESSDGRNR
jgi:hypothetical protein